MLNSVNELILAVKSRLGVLATPLRLLAIGAIVLFLAAILFLIFNTIWLYFSSRSYVNELAFAFGWNRHAANALAWIVFAAMAYLGTQIFSLSRRKRTIGIVGLLALLAAQSALLWLASRDQIIARDGQQIKCYVITRTGVIYNEMLDGRPTIEPTTGRPCLPVTVQLAERLRQYETGRRPRPIPSNAKFEFFDLATGEPIVWYHKVADGIEIFDLFGFHPDTGAELLPVTKEIVLAWRAQEDDRAKLPPEAVDINKYDPFDRISGKPRVWYRRTATGFQFYNRPGFDGRTGEQLAVITHDIVSEWRKLEEERNARDLKPPPRPPRRVDIGKHELFDHKTGEPRTWYWRGSDGEYEFYDGPGYHTRTGSILAVLTKDALSAWERDMTERARKIKEEQERREAEARKRRDQEEKDRIAREEQEKKDRLAREEQRRRDGELAGQCDQLAANPNDPRRVGDGVPFDTLRQQAEAAIAACERAVQQAPNELRFQYQLGRALQAKDRRRAAEIHQRLVRAGYPAAFDNLGWIYLQDHNNPTEAVNLFRKGMQAGDPDSIMSLIEMIDRGHITPPNPAAAKIELLMRARQLGHSRAAAALAAEEEKERQRAAQLEQQRRAFETMITIINGLPRR